VDGRAPDPEGVARYVVPRLAELGRTVAVAESLTGGLVVAALISVPGASAVVRGGVVAYMTDLKSSLLGVDPALLERQGPVHPDVARAMARGVAERLGADYGVATTGVAGPDPQDGRPVGEVHVAVAGPGHDAIATVRSSTRRFPAELGRAAIRLGAAQEALALLVQLVDHPQLG
jgi:nicotinamide-nucleotide amidase